VKLSVNMGIAAGGINRYQRTSRYNPGRTAVSGTRSRFDP
jgi:hypothetical protein